jgi:cellobiose phosphorylase
VLRHDPADVYSRMTFATRDKYRHVVERIAKRTRRPEPAVAQCAVDLARAAATDGGADHRAHVGYYLIDEGRAALERATAYQATVSESLYRQVLRHPNVVFAGGIVCGTLAALGAVLWLAGAEARTAWIAVLLFGLIPANDIAVSIVNQLVTAFLPPRLLPKLDLREHGVPEEYRTVVVIPTLFGSIDAVREAMENLEVQFLANRDAHLHFAILSDFTDSPTETRADDAPIVEAATLAVHTLNTKYAPDTNDAFYLFHRPRRWNERQGVWMGWERKRGKLAEFNRFLRDGAAGVFSVTVGDAGAIQRARYVITLDADTVLPPDAAPHLIGALAHPLNRAVYDPARGRVVRGYGILQPRVAVSLPSAYRSRFAAIHSGHPGVDPYTTAVSDVYQDLYGEGSFTGKGIYDVDAFEQATHGRFPENTLLSHDLIEGNYARAGLATDITVYDDYPARYLTHARRKHRWIRGDWQLLRWLTSRVPGPDGPEPNRLSLLSRWKILDNLRRSTVEIALMVFLVAGWTVLPGSPLRWTALGIAALAAPWVVSLLLALLRLPIDKSWRAYYAAVGRDAVTSARQLSLAIIVLPHQAWISMDAIVRTLWRLIVTKRHLLEWQPASLAERVTSNTTRSVWRAMWPAVAIAGGVLVLVAACAIAGWSGGAGLPAWMRIVPPETTARLWQLAAAVVPLVALWVASPAVAHALSAPAAPNRFRLSPARRLEALRYALLHWRFFDRFVGADTNWLAPDNFQEDPSPVLAMRTSPTNVGLQLLATASAYDLGFITVDEMTRRLELAFRSIERLRRFRGHLYNWYDLHDLHVLEPAYISTVDSGNLAGHLIAVRQACLTIPDDPVGDGRVRRALETACRIAQERLTTLSAADAEAAPNARRALAAAGQELAVALGMLAEVDRPAAPAAPLSAAAVALGKASGALESGGLAGDAAAPVTEWVAWGQRLIADHEALRGLLGDGDSGDAMRGRVTLRELSARSPAAASLVARLDVLARRASAYATSMDFRFLFDPARRLFAIGYQQSTHALDGSYYDLLASEARLASFIAVAKNEVPVEHWFRLGRTLTHAAGATALVSWSGSMFEYLMPVLVMESLPFTVLDQTYRGAVHRQIAYGATRGVPWGVSESAYNLRDRNLTYQYRAFGVPDLALKRGLARDLVVAPYATVLAVMVKPNDALANLRTLERNGALGPYGFRDALDYTRPEPGRRYAVVRTYMAHHIGMGLVALTNALTADVWQRRFHADPMVRSASLLLHERIPRRLELQDTQATRADEAPPASDMERAAVREIDTPDTLQPHVALLGRPPYTIMVSHAGGGYSRFEDLAVTRWRADGTRDDTGQFCYLKDITRGAVWSAAHQPVCAEADWYKATLATDRVTFHRADGDIETRTEIGVVPDDAAEVRRIVVTNNSDVSRDVELTSYGEIVLAPPDADRAHPAFGNLFVETEWHAWCSAITAIRRPRSAGERPLWCVHVVDTGAERVGLTSCETDRARFVGRGRSVRDPVALEADGVLSGTTGAVLDPIFALRTRVRLAPGQSASVAFTTLVATSRERAFELAGRYHDPHAAQRALDLAWTSAQVELNELKITPADAAGFQELAGHLFYACPELRAPQSELRRNEGSQARLWANGISGDWPIVLATIDSADGLPTLRQLFAAHHFWRRHGMTVDLVVLNEQPHTYMQVLNEQITATLFASSDSSITDRPGGAFVRRRDLLSAADLLMLRATARVHVPCDGRSLGRIIEASKPVDERDEDEGGPFSTPLRASGRRAAQAVRPLWALGSRLRSDGKSKPSLASQPSPHVADARGGGASRPLDTNTFGGIAPDGAYQISVYGDHLPPAPWSNVIANPHGGFIVTERGAGFSWAGSSYLFRLTPWHNDPVSDPVGDALYLQDDETGDVWSATPAPVQNYTPYIVRHEPGQSSFEHEHTRISTHLTCGIAEHDAVKISVLRVTNGDDRRRRIILTAYTELTLGVLREHTQHQVRTSFEPELGAIFARNAFDPEFADWVAFTAVSERVIGHTGDRREFLGRNGSPNAPAALARTESGGGSVGGRSHLLGSVGVGLDPCAALQCEIDIGPGETREVVVILGAAAHEAGSRELVARYRDVRRAQSAVAQTVASWAERLSVITVRTPEPTFDAMLNRWTLYQALSCRMWARSALYQSGGAYGFRDQLQDVMAFVYAAPALAREHIVRAAGRQFVEGDVQHWWHPGSGRGVRTRFSDDMAWLPYVVDHYVRITGDRAVLDATAPFLAMRALEPGEHEAYEVPQVSGETGTVYEHCVRALRKACTTGAHGLPLIGGGDWNDGMNRVGIEGRGESVWLAWFLATTLRAFAPYAEARGDAAIAAGFLTQAAAYARAVESDAWDGDWYRRAYFDDGTPLGSALGEECRIDSLAQSWSVISGAGDPERQSRAMRSLDAHLVRDEARLVLLLAPPFDRTPHDPGYIKGYLPGVRENGGQYTHAALWAALATARRGDGDRAFEMFQMLNPLTRSRTASDVETYKVEPYVVAADVYAAEGHVGRGGWTWYTGSASWMYRVGVETILGVVKQGETLSIHPSIPYDWREYEIRYRYGRSLYVILVRVDDDIAAGAAAVSVDGKALDTPAIPLVDDGARHDVIVQVQRADARVNAGVIRTERGPLA